MLITSKHWNSGYRRLAGALKARRAASLRGVLVLACIFALTAALATRYAFTTCDSSTVQQSVSQLHHNSGKRQNLDGDALTWVPPVPHICTLEAPSFYPRIAPAGTPLPKLDFDESLYNRPPPAGLSL